MEKKNLVLDLGGVIIEVNYHRTIDAFKAIGIPQAEKLYSQQSQIELFDQLEKGNITEKEFYDEIRGLGNCHHDDTTLRDCWNAILIGLPDENIKALFELKKKYRLFLLSNTNSIHETAYRALITKQYGTFIFDDIFEKMYLSHHIHLRKPMKEIFDYVIEDSHLNRSETLFIDDSIQHVEGARKAGIDSLLFPKGELLGEVMGQY